MQPPGKLTGVREISDHVRIPSPYLSKVLLRLRRGRMLRSYKGIGGGYELAQPPHNISLFNVIECLEGNPFGSCILEDRECSLGEECAMHESWGPVRNQLFAFLQAMTLDHLAEQHRVTLRSKSDSEEVRKLSLSGPKDRMM